MIELPNVKIGQVFMKLEQSTSCLSGKFIVDAPGRLEGAPSICIGTPSVNQIVENHMKFGAFSSSEVPKHRSRCSPQPPTSLSVTYT